MNNKLKATGISFALSMALVAMFPNNLDEPPKQYELYPIVQTENGAVQLKPIDLTQRKIEAVIAERERVAELERQAELKRQEKQRKLEEQKQLELSSRSQQQIKTIQLSDSERRVVECIVQGEAGSESYKGKVLVAQCILNGCLDTGMQPSGVRKQFQYSGWKENVSEDTKKAVRAVFDEGYRVVNEPILYFYAPKYCTSKWHETQTHVITEGGHKFFKRNK